MTKKVWPKKHKRYRTPRVTIQALIRGGLARIRARERAFEREMSEFIRAGRERAAHIQARNPTYNWLRQSAGAGGRPMAAGGGPITNPLPYAGGGATVPDDLPGHANMGARMPVQNEGMTISGYRPPLLSQVDRLRAAQNQNPHWIGGHQQSQTPMTRYYPKSGRIYKDK